MKFFANRSLVPLLFALLAGLAANVRCLQQASPAEKAELQQTLHSVLQAVATRSADPFVQRMAEPTVAAYDRLCEAARNDSANALAKRDVADRLHVRLIRELVPAAELAKLQGTDLLRREVREGWLQLRELAALTPDAVDFDKVTLDYVLLDDDEARGRPGDPWDDRPPIWFHFRRSSRPEGVWLWQLHLLDDRLKGVRGCDFENWTLKPGVHKEKEDILFDLMMMAAHGASRQQLQRALDGWIEPPPDAD